MARGSKAKAIERLQKVLGDPLVKGDVETPSDYDGVVCTDLDDAGGWKVELVRELKAAGFVVDANRVFQA